MSYREELIDQVRKFNPELADEEVVEVVENLLQKEVL